MKRTIVHVVSHTHWDREWQKTFNEYRTRLIKFMDDLIHTLEEDDNFETFMLDGQTSLIDDYLNIKPNMKKRLKKLIETERIIIGPWYVQPDEFLPSGESLLRNLLIGDLMSKEYGNKMNIGYLPDSFGQSVFMPQILNKFGIHTVVAMRGFDNAIIKDNEFIWEGSSQSEVVCSVLWNGYNNGYLLSQDLEISKKAIETNIDVLGESSFENNILVLAGSDQSTVKKFIPEIINRLNDEYSDIIVKQAKLSDYMTLVNEKRDNYNRFKGDFRFGQKQRVHISIAGSRTDFKQRNYDIQTKLEKVLEPISAIGYTLNDRYEEELIYYCWKRVVESHAHDSICNVCTDKAHKDMFTRIDEVDDIYHSLYQARTNNLIDKIQFDLKDNKRPILVFNSNSLKQEGFVEADVDVYSGFRVVTHDGRDVDFAILSETEIDLKDYRLWLKENPSDVVKRTKIKFRASVEGLGFNTYYIEEDKESLAQADLNSIEMTESSIANKFIEITTNKDGTVNIYSKKTKKSFNNIVSILDQGNAGDSYDFSPPENDVVISSCDYESEVNVSFISKYEASLSIKKNLLVNKTTDNVNRSTQKVTLPIEMIFTINAEDDFIDLKVNIENTAENHRVSLVIPNFSQENHYREGSFGDLLTDNEAIVNNTLDKGWKEHYYPTYSTQRYVYNKDGEFALLNKGVLSYEIDNKKDLKIHLLTTTDYMGKENLKHRPGRRSGGKIYTPDALLLGKHDFEFRILLSNNQGDIHKSVEEFQNPLRSFYRHKNQKNGYLSDHTTFFKSMSNNVATSALVKNPFDDDVIWRIKNMSDQQLDNVSLEYNSNLYDYACEVNMINEKCMDRVKEEFAYNYIGEEYEGSGELQKTGQISIVYLKPNEICNLKFKRR